MVAEEYSLRITSSIRLWPLGVVLVIAALGSPIWLHDFPWNGNPLAWMKANANFKEGLRAKKAGSNSLAVTRFSQAIDIYPGDCRFYNELAKSHMQTSRPVEAMVACGESLSLNPEQPDVLISLAQLHMHAGNFPAAMHVVNQALKLSPTSSEAMALQALILLRQGKAAQAQALFEKANSLPGQTARFWHFVGLYYAGSGRAQKAETALRQACVLERGNAVYQAALGNLLLQQEKWAAAEIAFAQASQLVPDATAYLANLSQAQYSQNKLPEAIESLSRAVSLMPYDWRLLQRLGQMEQQNKDYTAAALCFIRAATLDASQAGSWDGLMESLKLGKQEKMARASLNQFLSTTSKNDPIAWCYRAHLDENQGNATDAIVAYKRAMSLSANERFNQYCRNKLARLAAAIKH